MTPDEIATLAREAIMHAEHSARRAPDMRPVLMVVEYLRALLDDRDALKARVAELEKECSALAADQCHAGYGDEYGNHRCREVDAARSATLNLTSKEQTR